MGMNDELRDLYNAWKVVLPQNQQPPRDLGPPYLVKVTPDYEISPKRVLVIGQEDYGWKWSTRELSDDLTGYTYKENGKEWPHLPIESWGDFIEQPNSVDALMYGCEIFEFGKEQPKSFNSPLWQRFRDITNQGDIGAFTNLDRASYFDGERSGTIPDGPVREYLTTQDFPDPEAKLLLREIQILGPTVCIFLTGHGSDHLIEAALPKVEFEECVTNLPREQIARVCGPGLPPASYRTYHPGHLSRCAKGFYLDLICKDIARQASSKAAVEPNA